MTFGLAWAWPAWIGCPGGNLSSPDCQASPWAFPNQTAAYVVNWVAGAKAAYNVSIDVVGSWNEKAYSPAYLITLRAALDDAGFSSTRILCDDFNWQCALDMPGNPALAAAVDFVGGHDVVSLPADALPGKPRERCGGAAIAQGGLA